MTVLPCPKHIGVDHSPLHPDKQPPVHLNTNDLLVLQRYHFFCDFELLLFEVLVTVSSDFTLNHKLNLIVPCLASNHSCVFFLPLVLKSKHKLWYSKYQHHIIIFIVKSMRYCCALNIQTSPCHYLFYYYYYYHASAIYPFLLFYFMAWCCQRQAKFLSLK